MESIILFRKIKELEEERLIAERYFTLTNSRINLNNKIVIARYASHSSTLPYYEELDRDLKIQGSRLINTYEMHKYIANFEYYHDISEYTFKTWFQLQDIPEEGSFVIKGTTNSKKQEWATKMYAANKREAIEKAAELKTDSMLSTQDIIVRKFEQLEIIDYDIKGMPLANEHRFFIYKDTILSHGFYWSSIEKKGQINQEGIDLVQKVANILQDKINFYVIDIAQKKDGTWIVVEINDGQQSGLSDNDPQVLYSNLQKALSK